MGIIGLNEVARKLQISYKEAIRIANMPGCPVLPRTKWQTFRIPEEAFDEWVRKGCPQ